MTNLEPKLKPKLLKHCCNTTKHSLPKNFLEMNAVLPKIKKKERVFLWLAYNGQGLAMLGF
jgi:hypothetical protein